MTKKLNYTIELIVDEEIDSVRLEKLIQESLEELKQDSRYHEVTVKSDGISNDKEAIEVIDLINSTSITDIETAIETIDVLKDDEQNI